MMKSVDLFIKKPIIKTVEAFENNFSHKALVTYK